MALPKDARELFEDQVPKALARNPDKALEVKAIYCFKIAGEGGGEWTVDLANDPPSCKQGDDGSAQITIEVAHDDFKTMLGDAQAGMQLFLQGKLKVSGDPKLATKLREFFDVAATADDPS